MPSRILTRLGSGLWSGVNQTARWLTRQGFLESVSLGCRVISVGNIQVGGAGKTPLVAKICHEAIQKNLKVCILMRGYRSRWESALGGGVILPGDVVSVQDCGDEAALLHELCPQVMIGVGSDRVAQFWAVQKKAKSHIDWVILDDGFQHFKIKKDLEIVALTDLSPFEVLFRDSVQTLDQAQLLVWTKGATRPETAGRPVVQMRTVLKNLHSDAKLQGQYWLVTGIALPEEARTQMQSAGYRIQRHLSFKDHYCYSRAEVTQLLAESAADSARILLTGKDWVKWRELGIERNQVEVVEPVLEMLSGEGLWRSALWG